MNEGFFVQIVKKAGSAGLAPEKKAAIRQELELAMAMQPLPRREPAFFAVPAWLRTHSLAFACSMAGIAVIVSGTGVSLAAEQSLPGDRLYLVKTGVNERLRETFSLTAEAKIAWELRRVERRLAEADALSSEGRLDDDARTLIEDEATEYAGKAEALADDEDERERVEERLRSSLRSGVHVQASFEKRKITITEREEGEHDEATEPYDDEESDERERREREEEEDDDRERHEERVAAPSVRTQAASSVAEKRKSSESESSKKSSSSSSDEEVSKSGADNGSKDAEDEEDAKKDEEDKSDEDTGDGGDEEDGEDSEEQD